MSETETTTASATTIQFPLATYETLIDQLLRADDPTKALATALHCQAAYPGDPRGYQAVAKVHMAAGRFAGALLPLQRAEALAPNDPTVGLQLADCHNRRDDWYEAERYYRKVLAVEPDNIDALVRLEPIVREQGRYAEVRALLARVRQVMPRIERAVQCSVACLDLAEGKLHEGFLGYEHRFGYRHLGEAYGAPFYPRWDGRAPLTGKRILMRFEQGLGDTVQFVRYAHHLKRVGAAHVAVLCKPMLHRLVLTVAAVDQVLGEQPSEAFDYEVMMMSMPALLGTRSINDIPGKPYLQPDESDVQRWRDRLGSGSPKVGLVWSGELKRGKWEAERMNLRRSIPLQLLRPLFDADCTFVSLQKGERQGDLTEFYTPNPIIDPMNACRDFYDTAALIRSLDLVIAVDTAVAHVAGGLGMPVWMLSRLDGDWRWLLRRSDSPWYPSMTIYRQEVFADWRPTIKRVAGDLVAFGERYRSHHRARV